MGLRDIYEPVEVYQAAMGDPAPLARRIESGVEMKSWEREALACFLRGQLVPPKRGKGEKTVSYLHDTEAYALKAELENAAALYQHMMDHIRHREGSNYGKRKLVLEEVADIMGLSVDTLNNYLRRSKRAKEQSEDQTHWVIVQFHRWMRKNGHLPEYGPRETPLGKQLRRAMGLTRRR